MKALIGLLGITALLLAPDSRASEDVFGHLAGKWQGGGEVRGMASEQSMVWKPVLSGKFTRLEFENRMSTADGSEFHFQAHAYYRSSPDGEVTGHWFDSRGVAFPLNGAQTSSSLTIEWGTPDTEQGRTGYRITEDRLEVTDEVLSTDGEWRVFGRSTLQRVTSAVP